MTTKRGRSALDPSHRGHRLRTLSGTLRAAMRSETGRRSLFISSRRLPCWSGGAVVALPAGRGVRLHRDGAGLRHQRPLAAGLDCSDRHASARHRTAVHGELALSDRHPRPLPVADARHRSLRLERRQLRRQSARGVAVLAREIGRAALDGLSSTDAPSSRTASPPAASTSDRRTGRTPRRGRCAAPTAPCRRAPRPGSARAACRSAGPAAFHSTEYDS